jgi:hypothetical protein
LTSLSISRCPRRGAIRRRPAGGSAFSQRDRPYLLGIEANWDGPENDAENMAWARGLFAGMRRFSHGGMCLNVPLIRLALNK